MIKTAIRLKNDTVMVFDAEGEQLPHYQGPYEEMKESIVRDASPGAVFAHWFNDAIEPETVAREDW